MSKQQVGSEYPDSLITGKQRGVNGGRKPLWIGIDKNYPVKALRLPEEIYEALIKARGRLSVKSIVKKLKGLSRTSVDKDGAEYEGITPVELAELNNKLKKLEADKTKLVDNRDVLISENERLSLRAVTISNAYEELEARSLEVVQANQKLQNELDELYGLNSIISKLKKEQKIEREDSQQTIAALKSDIEKLESELVNLQSKQVEQKPQYEDVLDKFQQKALKASATSPRLSRYKNSLITKTYNLESIFVQ